MAPEDVNPEEFFGEPTPEGQKLIDTLSDEQVENVIEEELMPSDLEDDGMELKDGVPVFRPDHPRWRTFIDGGTIKWRSKLKERPPLVSLLSKKELKDLRLRYVPTEQLDKYVKETLEESTIAWSEDGSVMLLFLKDYVPVDIQNTAKEGLDKMDFPDPHRAETRNATAFNFSDGTPGVKAGELLFGFTAQGSIEMTIPTRADEQRAEYQKLEPLLKKLNELFAVSLPKNFAEQNRKIPASFRQFGTAFSTITVLKSCPSAVHTDPNGNKLGFTCLTTVRDSDSRGGEFCLIEYGLRIPVKPGDVLIAATAREFHCNLTPVHGTKYSMVCYYRWGLTNPKMLARWEERQERQRDSVQALAEPVPFLRDYTIKRGQRVREKSAPWRAGTVIMDSQPGEMDSESGEAVLVQFDGETDVHQFLAEELDLVAEP